MTLDDMESLLERLGIEPISTTGNEVKARCPGHVNRTGKEDHNPSWFINADTGAHICFSCHFKGGLMYLIGYINGYYDETGKIDFDKSSDWVGGQQGLSHLLDKALSEKVVEDPEPIDLAVLSAFSEPPAHALRSRGLSSTAARECQLLWDDRLESWIIPVFSGYTGDLHGWQQKAYIGRFFKNQPAGMKKSDSLYGYTPALPDEVVLVESPLDAVRLRSLGLHGVASFGSFVSQRQMNLIKSASRLIIAMDNDDAGRDATKRIRGFMHSMGFEAWFFDYSHTDQKDVGGMSRDEILTGIENARHSVALLGA